MPRTSLGMGDGDATFFPGPELDGSGAWFPAPGRNLHRSHPRQLGCGKLGVARGRVCAFLWFLGWEAEMEAPVPATYGCCFPVALEL